MFLVSLLSLAFSRLCFAYGVEYACFDFTVPRIPQMGATCEVSPSFLGSLFSDAATTSPPLGNCCRNNEGDLMNNMSTTTLNQYQGGHYGTRNAQITTVLFKVLHSRAFHPCLLAFPATSEQPPKRKENVTFGGRRQVMPASPFTGTAVAAVSSLWYNDVPTTTYNSSYAGVCCTVRRQETCCYLCTEGTVTRQEVPDYIAGMQANTGCTYSLQKVKKLEQP